MPKNRLNDFDTVAANNTDVSGIGIQGSNKPSNLDDAIRALMAQLADWREDTSLDDTASFNDTDDTTKTFNFSAANIPTATNREIDAEALYDLSTESDDIISLLTQKKNVFYGMETSNAADATNDITISAGFCSDSTHEDMIVLASALTKQIDATWVVGTNQGGLDTGVVADGTYFIHAIKRPDTGVVDALFSLSPTAPTLPANYTLSRFVAPVIRISGAIMAYSQRGNEILFVDPPKEIAVSNQGTTAVLRTLRVPIGIAVTALLRIRGNNAAGWLVLVSSPDAADAAPSATAAPMADLGGSAGVSDRTTLQVRTNTSGQIRTRSSASSTELDGSTYGFIFSRDA